MIFGLLLVLQWEDIACSEGLLDGHLRFNDCNAARAEVGGS